MRTMFLTGLLCTVLNGFSVDYFPLNPGNHWVYDYSRPKPPGTTCSWGNHTMIRIDSLFEADNATMYVANSYAVSEEDTCLVENGRFWYLDSAGIVYKIYDLTRPEERYFMGSHEYGAAAELINGTDTFTVVFHISYSRNGKTYENCYEISDPEGMLVLVYAPDIGMIAGAEEGQWTSLLDYAVHTTGTVVSGTSPRFRNVVAVKNTCPLPSRRVDIRGRTVPDESAGTGIVILDNKKILSTGRRLHRSRGNGSGPD